MQLISIKWKRCWKSCTWYLWHMEHAQDLLHVIKLKTGFFRTLFQFWNSIANYYKKNEKHFVVRYPHLSEQMKVVENDWILSTIVSWSIYGFSAWNSCEMNSMNEFKCARCLRKQIHRHLSFSCVFSFQVYSWRFKLQFSGAQIFYFTFYFTLFICLVTEMWSDIFLYWFFFV